MNQTTEHPNTPPLDWRLSASAYYYLIHKLHTLLPEPIDDTPAALAARNDAAIAEITAMLPVNGDEAALAARCVAARAQADEVLRLIRAQPSHDTTPDALKFLLRLNAQYALMERTATAIHRQLQRTQAARHKREANGATAQTDEWTHHIAQQRITEALRGPPPAVSAQPPATEPAPLPAPDQPPQAQAAPRANHAPDPAQPQQQAPDLITHPTPDRIADPTPDLITEADRYALTYPERARLIRRLGALPPDCDFGPPEPETVHAIATGSSPILQALDTTAAQARPSDNEPPPRSRHWSIHEGRTAARLDLRAQDDPRKNASPARARIKPHDPTPISHTATRDDRETRSAHGP